MFIVLTVEREEKGPLARAVEYLGRSPLKIYRKSFLGKDRKSTRLNSSH